MNLFKVLAKSLGYELINRDKNPSMMFHLMDLIQLNAIDLILDIGGNTGQFAMSIRNAGFSGEIHSFEPVTQTFEKLQLAAAEDFHWNVHNFAMGEAIGQSQINVTKSSDFASIHEPNKYGQERFKKNKVEYTESIEINTVDNFLTNHIPEFRSRRILLKTDTQGYDLKVLRGVEQSMELIYCLLSEISFIPIYSGMPHYLESLKVFESYGFINTGFYPITRNKTNLSLIEMDCIMIKAPAS